MTDTDRLIRQGLEIEGLLKILRDRSSDEALAQLSDKIDAYAAALHAFVDARAHGDAAADRTMHRVVKDQEAAETEEPSEGELAAAAIERGQSAAAPAATAAARRVPNAKLLRAFTLNDRFRYCRSLFGGDDADFTDTLKLLADMDSYDEAADYLTRDLLWDPSDAEVADFMAVLAANMPQ